MGDFKRALKRLAVGVGRIVVPRGCPRVVVLCYHSVSSTTPFASASPVLFQQHLRWLKEHCDIVGFRDVLRCVTRGTGLGRPAVALTFDDGYADNYECAFPLLLSCGVPAAFFVTAGFVEKDSTVMERFRVLRRARPEDVQALEWSHVREMRNADMEIGAHTYSHPNLALLSRAAAEGEVRRSKDLTEDRLGAPVVSMAYPFGKPAQHFTRETMAIVSEAGYECAAAVTFRTVAPSDSRFALPRFFVTQDSVDTLRDKVLGAWDLVGLWQEKAPAILRT